MGAFTNCGDANGDGIVSYDLSAGTFTSMAAPGAGGAGTEIFAGAFDSSGNLHVVGGAENIGGVPAADGYAYWDGSAWATNGAPAVTGADFLWAIAIDVDDNIYVGGDKDAIGGVSNNNIAMWDGSAWVDVGAGLNNTVNSIDFGLDGRTPYIGGDYTNAGGNATADFITLWNGQQYMNLGAGVDQDVDTVKTSPSGDIWIGGSFTSADGRYAPYVAIWNGAAWAVPDWDGTTVYDIEFTNIDPLISDNFDIYIGFGTSAATEIAGAATVTNDGNSDAWPTFYIKRSGGTTAILRSIRNETTGKILYFSHNFLDGETLTIQLGSEGANINSDFAINNIKSRIYSLIGSPRRKSLLANSDDLEFKIIPGDNIITCFVDFGGAPTITANCLFKEVYRGYDD
jgi:hypothetical protein